MIMVGNTPTRELVEGMSGTNRPLKGVFTIGKIVRCGHREAMLVVQQHKLKAMGGQQSSRNQAMEEEQWRMKLQEQR